ncbi:PREDICTED: triple functional domain protein-like isoform X2 [Nicrophorus vespilloides]|uniref:Triple functional domain protein-like isoform X2 n=1 Tax=Nicrophorus vespilloides TaxID=110193 RepID=A0ABM1N601_NICVS|nr:PREDICTED: triple functional domain protein-like isoform X2 [Nicrophorus vespilloides]
MLVAEEKSAVRASSAPPESNHHRRSGSFSMRQVYDKMQKYLKQDATGSDGPAGNNTSSPVNKRRGFSGRKWLPPPLRKLSQGKVEKTQQSTPDRPPLKKTGSDKRIKVPTEMGNKPSVSEGEDEGDERVLRAARSLGNAELANGGAEDVDDVEVELPPPMKPISEPILCPPTVPAIEENPCKREQHTENQERNSLFRDAKSESSGDAVDNKDLSTECSSNEATAALSGDDEKSAENVKKHLENRQYVLHELLETEENYVTDLALIVEGYMVTMRDENCSIPMPEDLKTGKDKMVFGNIESIYDWHKNVFMKELKRCAQQPGELGQLFKKYERKLYIYVVYCKNKPMSEFIVSEHLDTYFEELRSLLGHKLQICDLLIKPIQRITKYQLLLKDLLKYTERAGIESDAALLRDALRVMTVVPKAANDMMDVGRLQGFDGKITAQGKLLLNGPLIVSDLPANTTTIVGKNKELHVFLFEQSIIFSEASVKKNQFSSSKYYYKTHIQVNKMAYEFKEDSFFIRSTDPNKVQFELCCLAPTPELHLEWESTIEAMIQTQTDFLKAIQSPIAYQKELTRDAFPFEIPQVNRQTVNIPVTTVQQQQQQPVDVSKNRKTVPAIHKANTIGIPSEAEITNSKDKHQKKYFFDGLRRNKHKSDSQVAEGNKSQTEGGSPRRWSEAQNSTFDNHVMAPGTQARLVCEWPECNLGEAVTIIRYDSNQGYLVRTNTHLEEIWLPSHVLSNGNRKAWSFRFRKPSFTPGRRSIDGTNIQENIIPEVSCPEFRDKVKDCTAQSGTKVVFKCRVKPCGRNVQITWKKTEPDPCVMRNSGRFALSQSEDGVAMLIISNARSSDSGTYLCIASNDIGSAQCYAVLNVSDSLPLLREPLIQVISCSSVLLEWDNDSNSNQQFLVEYCKLGTGEWMSPNGRQPLNSLSYTVEHLIPGETYSFRVITVQNKQISLPSVAVTLPVADNLRWQQEQFKRRYIELEEIDRGRFSVVRRAQDRGTGLEVALKQVFRRKQPHKVTQAEYALLAGMQHLHIIHAMALFDNAPVPGIDTIVLELVKGPLLFNFIAQNDEYTESEVNQYAKQLISALAWLHDKNLAHLDVKPENVMIDPNHVTPLVKLIDFGDCVNTSKSVILPPACLEFASPELVLGQPVGRHTDYWAVGVFLYVLLSGVSPFLDDSMEETTANILKCDYCFPDEYFSAVSCEAKELIGKLLSLNPTQRISMEQALESAWIQNINNGNNVIPSSRLKTFIVRRNPLHHPATPTTPTNTTFFTD